MSRLRVSCQGILSVDIMICENYVNCTISHIFCPISHLFCPICHLFLYLQNTFPLNVMHQREPEKFKWYRLKQDVAKQEEREQEEVQQEELEQEEPVQDVDDIELHATSEEDLDESMQSGTSNELGAHWEESDEWSEG